MKSKQLEFYINFKKKLSKHGNVQFDLFKSTKFNPMKNSETIRCTLDIPETYFKEQTLKAHFKLNPNYKNLAEATVEDNRLKDLEDELNQLTEDK
jgi:hypothetical protein